MIFLIEYNRQACRINTFKKFKDTEQSKAWAERLRLELDLNRQNISNEIVLLQAQSEADLRLTHRRYFESVTEMLENFTK
jgi:hypothetical protein